MRPVRSISVVLAAALVLVPSFAQAQRVIVRRGKVVEREERQPRRWRDREPARRMTLAVGVLNYEPADDDFPMAALRADWRLSRWLRSELGVSYAMGDVPLPVVDGPVEVDTHLMNASIGLNAELPVPVVRPYVGVSGGLFARFDDEGGEDFVRPSIAVPVGLRLPITPRLGLRAEVRWRFDQHEGSGDSAVDREMTAGLSFGF
ncbi:MAG TPA: hypothetical protein VGE02_11155 [Gemmatimonadales bacterium]